MYIFPFLPCCPSFYKKSHPPSRPLIQSFVSFQIIISPGLRQEVQQVEKKNESETSWSLTRSHSWSPHHPHPHRHLVRSFLLFTKGFPQCNVIWYSYQEPYKQGYTTHVLLNEETVSEKVSYEPMGAELVNKWQHQARTLWFLAQLSVTSQMPLILGFCYPHGPH